MLRHLPLGQEFVNYRDCVEFMEKDGGVNVKVLLKFNRTDRFGSEIHWYEATGIGKKEFKIKRYLD